MAFSLLYSRLLLVFLLVLTSWAADAQQLDSVFLDAPRETIDLEKANEPQFQLFDEAFYQNQLFFLGESHGVQRLQLLDFALLRHLNQRAGVRYYLAEVDCAKAYYLNDYLRTGDEETLGRVFVSWVRTQAQWGNADFVEKIRRIRHLNLTLPAARRIRFVGIDGLQDAALMADYLAALRTTGRPLSPVLTSCLDSVQGALRHTPAAAGQ
jgi:erythromycin esterase-like protein